MSTMSLAPKGLTWSVLRLHRAGLTAWGVFLAGLVALMVWLQTQAGDLSSFADPCDDLNGDRWLSCTQGLDHELFNYTAMASTVSTVIAWMSFAVAVYAGGALVTRDLESDLVTFVWTQSASPARWLLAKLAVPAALLAGGTTVLVLVYRWMWQSAHPYRQPDWSYPDVYVGRGPVAVAFVLCALALGVLVGVLVRRTLPAMALAFLAMLLVYNAAERARDQLWPEEGALVDWGQWWSDGGLQGHPANHFWPLQLIESGLLLAIAAAATGTALWLLRRRTA
ncbi:hypothetical protein [Streptomyces sp. NBC_01304]|uniref:hypothetical protein n=1 Tax=Streptomyces sp. NBC_01304 TaxID=2903818 RepID=UPI002E12CD51|nr:hypothetical protein OG430_26750 [Streptomyces sp. NBC_01304]